MVAGDEEESRPPFVGGPGHPQLAGKGPFQSISLLDACARGRQAGSRFSVLEEMKMEVLTDTLAPHQPPAGSGHHLSQMKCLLFLLLPGPRN